MATDGTWRTAYFHGRTLRRVAGTAYAKFDDVETDEAYWLSGPKRGRTDSRYRQQLPVVEDDVRAEYDAFLAGSPLAGREHS